MSEMNLKDFVTDKKKEVHPLDAKRDGVHTCEGKICGKNWEKIYTFYSIPFLSTCKNLCNLSVRLLCHLSLLKFLVVR